MSMQHTFYLAKRKGSLLDVWEHAPYDELYKCQKELFWMGRSSDVADKIDKWFEHVELSDLTDELLENLGMKPDKDDCGWYADSLDVIDLDNLTPKQRDFTHTGYFLSADVNAFLLDECCDIEDMLYSRLAPEVYTARLQAESQLPKGAFADMRENGEKLAADYMYFSFVDKWSLEYWLNFAKELADMYQDEEVCVIHHFG